MDQANGVRSIGQSFRRRAAAARSAYRTQEVEEMEQSMERFYVFDNLALDTRETPLNMQYVRVPVEKKDGMGVLSSPLLLLEHPLTEMNYHAFSKMSGLSKLLLDVYEIANDGTEKIYYPVLPTPCACMYFKFDASTVRSKLCGMTTTIGKIELRPKASVLCVRFRVGAADYFTKMPFCKMANAVLRTDLFFPAVVNLCQEFQRSGSFDEKVQRIAAYFHGISRTAEYETHALIKRSVDLIHQHGGNIRVSDIAETIGYSERSLCRLFRNLVGVSTKQYCELIKMQCSLKDILMNRHKVLARTANSYGYFDQPHMNRMYQKFLGRTASEMRFFDEESCHAKGIMLLL